MNVILRDDVIVKVDPKGLDVGYRQKGVGIERLRWSGSKLIDLADLDTIYVESINGRFILHCIPVNNSQKVKMYYNERNNLINHKGTIRIKTYGEIQTEKKKLLKEQLLTRKWNKIQKKVGSQFERELDNEKLLHILIDYVMNNNNAQKKFLEKYIEKSSNLVDFENDSLELIAKASKKDKIHEEETSTSVKEIKIL